MRTEAKLGDLSAAAIAFALLVSAGCQGQSTTIPNPFDTAHRVPPPALHTVPPGTAQPYYSDGAATAPLAPGGATNFAPAPAAGAPLPGAAAPSYPSSITPQAPATPSIYGSPPAYGAPVTPGPYQGGQLTPQEAQQYGGTLVHDPSRIVLPPTTPAVSAVPATYANQPNSNQAAPASQPAFQAPANLQAARASHPPFQSPAQQPVQQPVQQAVATTPAPQPVAGGWIANSAPIRQASAESSATATSPRVRLPGSGYGYAAVDAAALGAAPQTARITELPTNGGTYQPAAQQPAQQGAAADGFQPRGTSQANQGGGDGLLPMSEWN
ncbi:hypothetical protein Mal64_04310 [Pseudobythopirellula maris]|uniref:IgA FC receptor n=1 Tax=Pseudobythopirellula maris TaxID=2527991 RepID=A0A5C5ZSK9_9BACT|nr:hypothetical protein [Pseudobythopirellula maris]TWT90048.1 hypothetical protein Mal64_04310 [Pseudobythopirellula maris]